MKKGFTLIELIVAMTIVIIVSSAGIISYTEVVQSSRDVRRKKDLTKLSEALELYKMQNKKYPSTGGLYYSSEPDNAPGIGTNGGDWIPGLVASGLVPELPRDPLGGRGITFCTNADGRWKRAYIYRSDNGQSYKLLSHCAAENPPPDTTTPSHWSHKDPFYDPVRPEHAWAVYSDNVARGSY